MILPSIIQSPTIITLNSHAIYFKDGITVEYDRQTFDVMSDMHGKIDERMQSMKVILTGTPVGMLHAFDKYYPYAVGDIGKSVFGNADKPVLLHTLAGTTHTFAKGAITQMPNLILSTTKTAFGQMQITCIGKSATLPTDAGYLKANASSAFNDTTFDESLIRTDNYSAAFGADPYDEIGAMDGFEIEIGMSTQEIAADDVGIADIILTSLTATARFAPSNLTEAQVDTLLAVQASGVLVPGQSIAKSNTDLVIASDYMTATIHKAGPKRASWAYGIGKHRHQGLEFTSKRTWTAGAANPLWTFEINESEG